MNDKIVSPTVMIRHAKPSLRESLHEAKEALSALDLERPLALEMSGGPEGDVLTLRDDEDVRACPFVFCAKFKQDTWVQCLAMPPSLLSVEQLGREKELQVAATWVSTDGNRTFARLYKQGKAAAQLEVSGNGSAPLEVCTFKSSIHPEKPLADCKTAQEAVVAFFAALNIELRNLQLVQLKDGGYEVHTIDGTPLDPEDLEETTILFYESLDAEANPEDAALEDGEPPTAKGNPASVALKMAIDAKDLEGVRRAIADGASLEFIPDKSASPLQYSQPKMALPKWRPIAEALLQAGAPIDGYAWEDPLLCTLIDEVTYELWCIEFVEALLEMGADINAPLRQPRLLSDESGTPLHLAIRFRHPLLAQFLISKGASLDTVDKEGKTPVERAEELAADDPDYDAAMAEQEPLEAERPQQRLTMMQFVKQELSKTDKQRKAEMKQRTSRVVKVVRHAAGTKPKKKGRK